MKIDNRYSTNLRNLISASLLAAIAVILTRFFGVPLGIFRISLGTIPIMLSGIALGPIFGLATGAVADLVGVLINLQGGAYFPGFTLTAALVGFLPGFLLRKRKPTLTNLAIAIGITELLCHILLNTLWVGMITGKAYIALLPTRVYSRLVHYPIITGAIFLLLQSAILPSPKTPSTGRD